MKPKVSIIIPVYNVEKYLKQCLDSAVNQTYENIEIIIIDDASTDNSIDIINFYVNKYNNIKFIKNNINKGVVYSRNLAIKHSNSKYILPLDADDYIDKTYVTKAVNIMENNNNIGIVYSRAKKIYGNKDFEWILPKYDKNIIFGNCIFSCALFKKSDFDSVNGYKEYMNLGCEDFDLWLSFIEKGLDVYKIDEILFFYRKGLNTCRSDLATSNRLYLRKQLIKNHLNLYLDNEEFILRVFEPNKVNIKYNIFSLIFSVKNIYRNSIKYKIITILGIKFKIKVKNNKPKTLAAVERVISLSAYRLNKRKVA